MSENKAYDPYKFTSADYLAARKKWKERLVGSPELNDLSDPAIKEKIDIITRHAEDAWRTINRNDDKVRLWGDTPPVESSDLPPQYCNLAYMAKAWGTYGSPLYQNEELALDIIDGVEWMYRHMYGEAELAGEGCWRDPRTFNWWDWYIPSPGHLTDIFFIMEERFAVEDRKRYLRLFTDLLIKIYRTNLDRARALSRVCIFAKVGIAIENPDMLERANADFEMLLDFVEDDEGPRVDFVQWSHGMAYNNGYGIMNLDRVLYVAASLAGTPVEFKSPKLYNHFLLAKYMYEAAMYKGQSFKMLSGRQNYTTEYNEGSQVLAGLLQLYGMFGEEEDAYLAHMFRRVLGDPDLLYMVKDVADIPYCVTLNKILTAGEFPAPNDYEYAHSWYTADKAAQHRNDYAFAISMSSKRAPAFEAINWDNINGWYNGDGTTHIYTRYDSHQYDGANFYYKNNNIALRFPGTTEDAREREARSISWPYTWRPKNSFAGSMQIDDKYIVAGMDFISLSVEEDKNVKNIDGYSHPVHVNDLVAKKAWFCFDEEMLCLGAGITSTMNSEVRTTVEHRRIVDKDNDIQTLGGVELPKESFERIDTGASYVNMHGHAGFVFLGEQCVYTHRYTHGNDGTFVHRNTRGEGRVQDFFEVRIEHGVNPTDATYAYAVLPYASDERLSEYAKSPDVEIIANNEKMQIVRKESLGITGYVFYAPGDKGGVMAYDPCIVTMTSDTLSVTDPTKEADSIKIMVWRELEIIEKSPEIDVDIAAGRTVLTVNTKNAHGKKFEIKFISETPGMKYRVNYKNCDSEEFLSLSRSGAAALFLYSDKVLVNGEHTYLNEGRVIAKSGVIYAPVSLFTDILGINSEKVDTSFGVSYNGATYLPVLETARALGYLAESYYQDRLIVIGGSEHIAAMNANPRLEEAGAYAVFGSYDASRFTSADYKLAKDEWRLRLVGSSELNDLSDSTIAGKIGWISTKCKRALEGLNRNSDRVILWGDKPPVESDDLWRQYIRISDMAIAWGTYGSDYYHDESVLADVLDTMEWMYENMYGEAEIAGTGWRNVHLFNWWHWYVGAPDALTDAMLVIEEHLTKEQKKRYLKCYEWITTVMYSGAAVWGASSGRLKAGTKCALLLEDPVRLFRSQRDCDATMGIYEYGAGIHKADYVNWTHSMPHNISYGYCNLERGLYVSSILAATPLDFAGPKKYNQFDLVKYCYEPAIYRSQGFVMFSGRSTFSDEINQGAAIIAGLLPMIGTYGEDEDNYLKHFIKRNLTSPEIIEKIKSRATIYECAKLKELLADDGVSGENDYDYAHAWFTGDRAAQHRNNYAVGIAMSSRREKAYESINSANKTGWYTGDGATYLYTTYDGNQYDGKNFIMNNENIAYRFPGTTEDSQPRVARSICGQYEWYPTPSFVGSMELYHKYIVAAMDYESMNCDGPDDHPDDYGHGGSQPVHHNDLVAKKAWFCFDDEIVCLGAGITSTMNSDVHTTVEHRRIVNKESDIQTLDGARLPTESFEKIDTGAHFVNMQGHAGYVFLGGESVYTHRYTHEAAGGQDFFEVRIEHGKNPTGATYAYAIVPYATDDKLAEYAKSPDVEVISNTPALQAVHDKSSCVTGIVFHEPGKCCGITAEQPCIVTLGTKDGVTTLAVMDPTQKLDSVTLALDGRVSVISQNGRITVSEEGDNACITANTFMSHGRKYELSYKANA